MSQRRYRTFLIDYAAPGGLGVYETRARTVGEAVKRWMRAAAGREWRYLGTREKP